MKKSIFCLIFAFFSLFCFGFSVVPASVSKAETKTETLAQIILPAVFQIVNEEALKELYKRRV